MAKKSSTIEELFDIGRRLPWWLGLLLAIVTYLYLHHVAVAPQLPPTEGSRIEVTGVFAKGVATALQYILPLVFTLSALASFVDQRRRRREYDQVVPGGLQAVADSSWQEFERVVGEAFRRKE